MNGFAQYTLFGNATKDAELMKTKTGIDMVTFSVAVNKKDQEVKYFDCKAFNNTAVILAKYVRRGKPLILTGEIDQRRYEDKDGNKRSSVEFFINQFFFVGDAKSEENRPIAQHEVLDQVHRDSVVDHIDDKPIDLSEIPF